MLTLGNTELMKLHKVGYFASSKIASLSVLPTLDWAAEIAGREDMAVVSGFHSKMEREVLDYLLRGSCGIVCVLGRTIYRKIPANYKEAFNQKRVLFISKVQSPDKLSVDRHTATQRNKLISSLADQLVFTSLTSKSSLYQIYQNSTKPKFII